MSGTLEVMKTKMTTAPDHSDVSVVIKFISCKCDSEN